MKKFFKKFKKELFMMKTALLYQHTRFCI